MIGFTDETAQYMLVSKHQTSPRRSAVRSLLLLLATAAGLAATVTVLQNLEHAAYERATAAVELLEDEAYAYDVGVIIDKVPSDCDPELAHSSCNPIAKPCTPPNASLAATCMTGGALAFCGYAALTVDGFPSDVHDGPKCALNGQPVPFAPPPDPVDAYAAVGSDFTCFNSSKQGWDRLCIPRAYAASIDCVPDAQRATLLREILARGEEDYREQNQGRQPRFQCFHRGGYGSVAWLHLHSFAVRADSICPLLSTHFGASPNPLPHKIVCANGERSVEGRVAQMLESMGMAAD